jgi:hypothetical protein
MQFDWQLLIVVAILAWAISYLIYKFYFKKPETGCSTDCGCSSKQSVAKKN